MAAQLTRSARYCGMIGSRNSVAVGTTEVSCDPAVPFDVQQDFADLFGACPE